MWINVCRLGLVSMSVFMLWSMLMWVKYLILRMLVLFLGVVVLVDCYFVLGEIICEDVFKCVVCVFVVVEDF